METTVPSVGAMTVLVLGLVLGFKHAIEADHVVAVSAIVSQHRNIWRSAIIGMLWGLGHTASLFLVGLLVIGFGVTISETVSGWAELVVAAMIVVLGVLGLIAALRQRHDLRCHQHEHAGQAQRHMHFHESGSLHTTNVRIHSHSLSRIGLKPLVVGSIHGLAGSAPLTLVILPQVKSVLLGVSYMLTFGLGSVGGMLLISVLISLPFALSGKLTRNQYALQFVAASLSVIFGMWYAYVWTIAH